MVDSKCFVRSGMQSTNRSLLQIHYNYSSAFQKMPILCIIKGIDWKLSSMLFLPRMERNLLCEYKANESGPWQTSWQPFGLRTQPQLEPPLILPRDRCTIVQSPVLRLHDVRPSVRLSVCLSVCNVGGSESHNLAILETIMVISPTPSLFVAQRPSTYSRGNMGKFWGD